MNLAAALPAPELDPRWAAVVSRDTSAEGFFYSVRTTGVYCRPACAARTPNPRNVAFHATAAEARAAGFRACRRCRPDEAPAAQRQAELVARACRTIEAAQEAPTLAALAREAELSPHHFHRLFRSVTGLTPRAYAAAARADRLRQGLAQGDSVTEAIHAAGYGSTSRVYERPLLGMTPSGYRAGGAGEDIVFAVGQSSFGAVLVARSDRGVCAILMGDDAEALARDLAQRFPKARLVAGDSAFEALVARVVGFVEAPRIGLELPLDVRGTAFQRRVWQALQAIPAGATASYADVAAAIGAPSAVRAVAGACAANPLAVAVPCHRVVRTDGGLSGYRWGAARKRALLAREAVTRRARSADTV